MLISYFFFCISSRTSNLSGHENQRKEKASLHPPRGTAFRFSFLFVSFHFSLHFRPIPCVGNQPLISENMNVNFHKFTKFVSLTLFYVILPFEKMILLGRND